LGQTTDKKTAHYFLKLAEDSNCYVYDIARYDPDGRAVSTSLMCSKEKYDRMVIAPDRHHLDMLVENLIGELTKDK